MNNPYSPPRAPVRDTRRADADEHVVEYAGFWIRVAASIIDSILVVLLTAPVLIWYYGFEGYFNQASLIRGPAEFLVSYVFPAIAVILFWVARSATPGKMLLSLKILDAETHGPMRTGQAIGRYFGYYLSTMVLMLGFLWVAFDARKQGWHDKLAGTVVIQARK
jgi:uncharacterized RDD family membrane protein YckC